MEIALPVIALLLGYFLVLKLDFFRLPGLRYNLTPYVFVLKVACGIALYLIYSQFYTYRNNSDAFRYFDDAAIMYDALKESPGDFFRMLSGFGSDAPHLEKYYSAMNNWNLGKTYNFYNDNRTMIRFNVFIMLFSFGAYHVHTVVVCFLSLCGLTALYRFFVQSGARSSLFLFLAVFALPSVLFWGSGVLKEGLLIFGLGGFLYAISNSLQKGWNSKRLLAIGGYGLVLFFFKIYVLLVLIPCLAAFLLGRKAATGIWLRYAGIVLISVLLFFTVGLIPGLPDPPAMIAEKQNDFQLLARGGTYVVREDTKDTFYIPLNGKENVMLDTESSTGLATIPAGTVCYYWKNKRESGSFVSEGTERFEVLMNLTYTGSKIDLPMLEPGFVSWVRIAPIGLFNVLFRPFLWEATNLFMIGAAIENLLFILALALAVFGGAAPEAGKRNLLFFCISFSLLLFMLIGLVTPVAGAIVRYKIPALPFVFTAFYLLLDEGKKTAKWMRKW